MINIKPLKVHEYLANHPTAVVVDVRTPEEWKEGIADCASLKLVTITSNLDSFMDNLKMVVPSLESHVFFICKSGGRSSVAAASAEKAGYKNCYNVHGGFIEWMAADLPVMEWDKKA